MTCESLSNFLQNMNSSFQNDKIKILDDGFN